MTWPSWIGTLKQRFLADEASAFLLHGAVHDVMWEIEGDTLDAVGVLVRFLGRSKPIVGVMKETGLRFPKLGDSARFHRVVSAAEMLAGRTLPNNHRSPIDQLGRMWMGITSTGDDQGWIVVDVQRIVPAERQHLASLPSGTPRLSDWPTSPALRKSNHVVVFLAPQLDDVRPDLIENASVILLESPAAPRTSASEPERSGVLSDLPRPPRPARELDPQFTRERLEHHIRVALETHPRDVWAHHLPLLDAVSQVVRELVPESPGHLSFTVDSEGVVTGSGDGAEAFLDAWRADIALSASAGMLIGKIRDEGEVVLDAVAIGALTRRTIKLATRMDHGSH